MNRQDRETLAGWYLQRRIREGVLPAEALVRAQIVYGLTGAAVARLHKTLEAKAK